MPEQDSTTYLEARAREQRVDLTRASPAQLRELQAQSERCIEARRLNEGIGVEEAEAAFTASLSHL